MQMPETHSQPMESEGLKKGPEMWVELTGDSDTHQSLL